jgi:hypothetical protein
MKRILFLAGPIAALTALAISVPAHAEVKTQGDNGFNVVQLAEVAASPEEIWKRLISPKDYWSKEHSWSGSSAGFFIEAQAGGCFCELLNAKPSDGLVNSGGSVEHMRVIFVQPGKVLRMQGALGPLQSEAVIGTLTVAMQPVAVKKGAKPLTKLSFSYVVGGYMRYKVSEIAPAVDKVIGEQFANLIKPFSKSGAIEDKASNWSLDLDSISDTNETLRAGELPEASGNPDEAADARPADEFIEEGTKKPVSKPRTKTDAAKPVVPKPDSVKRER